MADKLTLTRYELNEKLKRYSDNVYFQPTSDIRLQYPCIIYNVDEIEVLRADDGVAYKVDRSYNLTIIDEDPDSEIPYRIIQEFAYSTFVGVDVTDGLYHNRMKLYYT